MKLKQSIIDAFLLLLCIPSLTAYAAEAKSELPECVPIETELYPDLRRPASAAAGKGGLLKAVTDPYESLKQLMIDGIRQKKNTIDLPNSLVIGATHEEKLEFIQKAFLNIKYNDPEATYCLENAEILFWYRGDYEWWIQVDYDAAVLQEQELVTARIDAACDECFSEGMSDLEKIVVAHDWLVANCQYDPCIGMNLDSFTAADGTVYQENHRVFSLAAAFVDRNTVCNGYALAFKAMMNRAGIPCCYTISSTMNHAWNLVQLDGTWYHIDVTWDDPMEGYPGAARHYYMLKSDGSFESPDYGHSGWTTEYSYICENDYQNSDFSALDETPVFLYQNCLYGVITGASSYERTLCAFPLGSDFDAAQAKKFAPLECHSVSASALERKRGFFFYLDRCYEQIDDTYQLVTAVSAVQLNFPEWKPFRYLTVPTEGWIGMAVFNDQLWLRANYANISAHPLPEPELFSTDRNLPLTLLFVPDLSLRTLAQSPIRITQTGAASPGDCFVCAACYQANGRLLSVSPVEVRENGFSISAAPPETCAWMKFFVADAANRPVSGVLTLTADGNNGRYPCD